MMKQPRLAIPARSDQSDIPIILDRSDEFFGLLLAVAEELWATIAHHDKWIFLFHARIIS